MNQDTPDSLSLTNASTNDTLGEATSPPRTVDFNPSARRKLRRISLLLFLATCLSTFLVSSDGVLLFVLLRLIQTGHLPEGLTSAELVHAATQGLIYSASIMTILVCHEMGHYLQTRRYGVPSTLPFFIPMPIPPIGTMGAVIAMSSNMGNRRALFDIGISGPLAGLVPTLIFCVLGLHWSEVVVMQHGIIPLGDPLLLRFLAWLRFGALPEGADILLHPMAFAAWVGLLITSLNLIPIGQLDGGHVLYALLRKKAHRVASFLLLGAGAAVVVGTVVYGYPAWVLMVVLLFVMGPIHPPTADDNVPLGTGRVLLGWFTLAFIFIGFTPTPFKM